MTTRQLTSPASVRHPQSSSNAIANSHISPMVANHLMKLENQLEGSGCTCSTADCISAPFNMHSRSKKHAAPWNSLTSKKRDCVRNTPSAGSKNEPWLRSGWLCKESSAAQRRAGVDCLLSFWMERRVKRLQDNTKANDFSIHHIDRMLWIRNQVSIAITGEVLSHQIEFFGVIQRRSLPSQNDRLQMQDQACSFHILNLPHWNFAHSSCTVEKHIPVRNKHWIFSSTGVLF